MQHFRGGVPDLFPCWSDAAPDLTVFGAFYLFDQ